MKVFSEFMATLTEKGLSNKELEDLIVRARRAAQGVVDDDEKSSEEKSRAEKVIDWIADVEQTLSDDGKLHPNAVK